MTMNAAAIHPETPDSGGGGDAPFVAYDCLTWDAPERHRVPWKRFQNSFPLSGGCKLSSLAVFTLRDSFYVAVGAEDGVISIYDLQSMSLSRTFTRHAGSNVLALAATSEDCDQPLLVSGSDDQRALVWRATDSEVLFELNAAPKLHSMAISSAVVLSLISGAPVAVLGSHDKSGSLWCLTSGACLCRLDDRAHTDLLLSLSHCRLNDTAYLLSSSWDKTVRLWALPIAPPAAAVAAADVPILSSCRVLRGHTKSVTAVHAHICRQSKRIEELSDGEERGDVTYPIAVTGSLDKTAIVWDLLTGEKIRVLTGHTERLTAVRIYEAEDSGLPPLVISASEDTTLRLWHLLSGLPVRVIAYTARVTCVHLLRHPCGLVLVSGSVDGRVSVWNLCGHDRMRCFETSPVTAIAVYTPRAAAAEPDQPLVLIGDINKECTIFNLDSGNRRCVLRGHKQRINALTLYSPPDPAAAPLVISCAGDASIKVWDLRTQQCVATLLSHNRVVYALAVYDPAQWVSTDKHVTQSELSRLPLIASGGLDKDIRLWALEAGDQHQSLRCWRAHEDFVRCLAVHHPSLPGDTPKLISASYDRSCKVWALDDPQALLHILHGHVDYVFGTVVYDAFRHLGDCADVIVAQDADNRLRLDAMVITASYDQTAATYDLRSGRRLATLRGHKDSVTALAVHVPSTADQPALIVTGGIDKMVIVWHALTAERLQTLVGHTDRICFLATYEHRGFPLVLSGSDDRRTIVWEDALYSRSFMPLRHAVNRCFDADAADGDDWPMLTALVRTYGAAVFYENSHLFFLAVRHARADFLLKFRAYLKDVLPFMRKFPRRQLLRLTTDAAESIACITPGKEQMLRPQHSSRQHSSRQNDLLFDRDRLLSLLEYALEMSDLISLHAILLSWIENLNSDVKDLLTQHLYHPCYAFLSLRELKPLGRKYPLEYIHFLTALRLVRCHPSLLQGVDKLRLDRVERSAISGAVSRGATFDDVWLSLFAEDHPPGPQRSRQSEQLLETLIYVLYNASEKIQFQRRSDEQSVTALFLPLRAPSTIREGFGLWVELSEQLNDLDIFASEVATIAIKYRWTFEGRPVHIYAMLRYLLFLCMFVFGIYLYIFHLPEHPRSTLLWLQTIVINAYIALLIAIHLYYLYEELMQMDSIFHHRFNLANILSHFLRDLWNVVDLGVLIAGVCGWGLALVYQSRVSRVVRCFLATNSVLMWFKILYFLRPFSTSGPLVVMILQIMFEIRFFLIVLFVVLAGFTQGFWLLHNVNPDSLFGTVSKSLRTSFFYMLGSNIDETMPGALAPEFATVLLILFMLFMMILMLNLLIALMGDVFGKIRSESQALWRKEQTSIIFEQSFLRDRRYTPAQQPYIHVLRYTSDLQSASLSASASKRLEAMEALVRNVEESVNYVAPFTKLDAGS